jgi:tetratricopeptide (TPR) repeat protein
MKNLPTLLLTGLAALAPVIAGATSLSELQNEWARISYESPAPSRLEAMTKLKATADSAVAAQPDSAELLIWDGIITSSVAGLKGGLGALSLAKEARALLEKAQARNPGALNGSALTSLGALYYQVPGWPIGFGSNDKARSNLEAALRLDHDGIDPNYFYADFLFHQGDYSGARTAAQRALSAPSRAGRELADKGRRGEVQALLARIGEKSAG